MSENNLADECLFLGGPADGKRIFIESGRSFIAIPEKLETTTPNERSQFLISRYRRERLSGPDRDVSIFVSDSVTLDDVLDMLVEGYRPHGSEVVKS